MSFTSRYRNINALLILLLPTVVAMSQQAPVQPVIAQSQAASRMFLDVVVSSKPGAPVSGLQAQDFTLFDNKTQRPVTSFQEVKLHEVPTEAILVIDAVNASPMVIANERIAVEKFLRANNGALELPTSLVLFTNAQTEVKALSKDGNMLSETLKNSVIARRTIAPTTGNFGAVERLGLSIKTLHQLLARESSLPGRKIILWVSPGWPMLWGPGTVDLTPSQQSEMFSNVVNLSRELRDGRFTVYFVNPLGAGEDRGNAFYYKDFLKGISKPSQVYAGALALQVLAIQSGGLVFNASNDIAGELQMCMADNANYYGLSFDSPPAEHPDEYHQIEIQIAKPGLVARTREGYYNQP